MPIVDWFSLISDIVTAIATLALTYIAWKYGEKYKERQSFNSKWANLFLQYCEDLHAESIKLYVLHGRLVQNFKNDSGVRKLLLQKIIEQSWKVGECRITVEPFLFQISEKESYKRLNAILDKLDLLYKENHNTNYFDAKEIKKYLDQMVPSFKSCYKDLLAVKD